MLQMYLNTSSGKIQCSQQCFKTRYCFPHQNMCSRGQTDCYDLSFSKIRNLRNLQREHFCYLTSFRACSATHMAQSSICVTVSEIRHAYQNCYKDNFFFSFSFHFFFLNIKKCMETHIKG